MQITSRYHQHSPWRAVAKDAPDLALKFHGTAAELSTEFTGERSQTSITNSEAYFCDGALRSEHLLSAVHAQASKKIMRSLAESSAEQPMEMKFGKTRFARCLLQQNAGLVPGSEQVASTAEPAKSVVVEQL